MKILDTLTLEKDMAEGNLNVSETDSHVAWIRHNVRYDPLTGFLHWKIRAKGRMFNRPIGCTDTKGYIKVQLNNVGNYAHRVGWLLHTGSWPVNEIDHINRLPYDNSFDNLRDVTVSQNQMNRGLMATNTTGVQGASLTPYGKYKVTKQGKFLGNFDTKEEARAAYENN